LHGQINASPLRADNGARPSGHPAADAEHLGDD